MEGQHTNTETTSTPEQESTVSHSYIAANDQQMVGNIAVNQGSIAKAVILGLLASVGSAVIWALITVATEYQIGYMALALGFAVGFAVRFGGKGQTPIFGVIGAILAVLGCFLGNYFSVLGFIAKQLEVGVFQALQYAPPNLVVETIFDTAGPIDLLFYALAGYEGFKFGIMPQPEPDLVEVDPPVAPNSQP
ncbi:MAG: hypothetical protein SFW35_00590 [Chitinophagales bacterium]|nr:hypothetical protein [Chitinophagales bacterium]